MDELVTIRTFNNSMEFEMAKAYLESMGIDCYGRDEITNRADLNNVNGGAKLEVRPDDMQEAVQLLLDAGYLMKEDFEPSPEMKWLNRILNFFRKK